MDDLIKNIKNKLSVDSFVEMMKDAKVIDDNRIKEEDVRRTLEKIDTNNLIDVDELATKLNEVTEQAENAGKGQPSKTQTSKMIDKAKSSFGVLSKAPELEKEAYEDINDNVTGFLD